MIFEFPELQRPQYPSSPELLLSALAWSVVPRQSGTESTGLIYERRVSVGRSPGIKKVVIKQTKPQGETLRGFADALRSAGMGGLDGPRSSDVAAAIANSITGVPPQKGVGRASSAVGIAGALLQDAIGGLATANPPNFAHLLNTMYVLGGGSGESAAERWFAAARFHADTAPLRPIEKALATTTLAPFLEQEDGAPWPPASARLKSNSRAYRSPSWWERDVLEGRVGTPFAWFRSSWDLLCSRAWHSRLSPRRWASWAVCVLRHALGFGFLWEANFYLEIAKALVDDSRDPRISAQWAVEPPRPLLPNQRGSVGQMDVSPAIKRLLTTGLTCRKAIASLVLEAGIDASSIEALITTMRARASRPQIEGIRRAVSGVGDTAGLQNLVETVRYSLLTRSGTDTNDNYGLLRVVSRNYTHVSPGAEWIVVMAAMSSTGPDDHVRLGDVMLSLKSLGFRPRIDFLLRELERAGLCASAADGDEGIEISLGFGGK